jgi:hypothetical protein
VCDVSCGARRTGPSKSVRSGSSRLGPRAAGCRVGLPGRLRLQHQPPANRLTSWRSRKTPERFDGVESAAS